jgi:hypothetical protein
MYIGDVQREKGIFYRWKYSMTYLDHHDLNLLLTGQLSPKLLWEMLSSQNRQIVKIHLDNRTRSHLKVFMKYASTFR